MFERKTKTLLVTVWYALSKPLVIRSKDCKEKEFSKCLWKISSTNDNRTFESATVSVSALKSPISFQMVVLANNLCPKVSQRRIVNFEPQNRFTRTKFLHRTFRDVLNQLYWRRLSAYGLTEGKFDAPKAFKNHLEIDSRHCTAVASQEIFVTKRDKSKEENAW